LILLTGKSKEELVEIGINKEELINEVNQLEKYLSKNAEYLHFSSVKWQDIKAKLKNDEYAIEIVRSVEVVGDEKGKVNYIALIIDSDKKQKHPTLVKLEEGDSLEGDFFNFYRNAFNYKIHDNKSYSRYWEPIAKVIKEGAKVYLSPEGVYMLMNIEALEVSGSEVVMDRNEIVLLGNTRDILSSKSTKTKNVKSQALLIGSPEFYQKEPVSSVKPLDGAKEEVDLLSEKLKSKDWGVKTYVGGEAIEKRFLEGEGVRLIHVATHGYFENTKQMIFREEVNNSLFKSGLIMTGGGDLLSQGNGVHQKQGVLTSYEALNLKLDNVELVVLSACETGVGEVKNGEGVYGLQRSFLIAGASNVIMSLYKVPDVVTMELMLNFYDNWLESNDKHDAFMKAKQTVRAKYNSPYYWGAFVIIGMD
jgi:CHAT domain-containing protein